MAAVIVCAVHVMREARTAKALLDGNEVERITAFLVHLGGDENPKQLFSQQGVASKGCNVSGAGFFFDDSDPACNPIALMHELISRRAENRTYIFPYLGGRELNATPDYRCERYVMNVNHLQEPDDPAASDILAILRERVMPERVHGRLQSIPWWQYERPRPRLYQAVKGLSHVLACSQTSKYRAMARVPNDRMFDQKLVVFPYDSFAAFAVLQSLAHTEWAIFFGSTMKDDPVYTATDCFETFPVPPGWVVDRGLEAVGAALEESRGKFMLSRQLGLTDFYNRFHDRFNQDPDIVQLRVLHAAMDRAVLDAYGWSDIPTDCDFYLDYEIDEETWGDKKKPYRYRWPDAVRDEVLARLLDLNQRRYQEEVAAGLHGKTDRPAPKASKAQPGKPAVPRARKPAPATATPAQLPFATRRQDGDDE